MASLIPSSGPGAGVIFNVADTAPSPSKDYCQILVTWDQVIIKYSFVANYVAVRGQKTRNGSILFPEEIIQSVKIMGFDLSTAEFILCLENSVNFSSKLLLLL